jgi:hypothetical protein
MSDELGTKAFTTRQSFFGSVTSGVVAAPLGARGAAGGMAPNGGWPP